MRHISAALIVFVVTVAGCGFVSEAGRRAITPIPADSGAPAKDIGEVPASEIARRIPEVVGNPFDFSAWGEIASAIVFILGGYAGARAKDKVASKLRKTSDAS